MSELCLSSCLFLLMTLVSIGVFYIYMQHACSYWAWKGVEYFKPSFLLGNFKDVFLMKSNFATVLKDLHFQIKSGYAGIYLMFRPGLLVRDRDLLECILVKDFEYFADRGVHVDLDIDPLSANMYALNGGEMWRNMHKKMMPLFSNEALKMMHSTIYDIGMALQGYVGQIADIQVNNEVDINDLSARYLTDITVSIAFGIEIDSIHDPNTYFRKMGARITDPLTLKSIVTNMLVYCCPKLCSLLKLKVIDNDVEEFMIETVRRTLQYREKNKISRNDFMQILIQIRNGEKLKKEGEEKCYQMTIEECAAQVYLLFIGGFKTSSTLMAFCLYELARNQTLLKQVQEDIDRALNRHNWKLTYECIKDMSLLYMCIDETLRMYPPCFLLQRMCTKDYTIPKSNVIIEKGTLVLISIEGIQRDPELYPNPDKFDPFRFTPEEKAKRPSMDFLALGRGPRGCNAKELGYHTAAMGLAALISKFDFEVKRPLAHDMFFDPQSFMFLHRQGIYLKISRRVFRT